MHWHTSMYCSQDCLKLHTCVTNNVLRDVVVQMGAQHQHDCEKLQNEFDIFTQMGVHKNIVKVLGAGCVTRPREAQEMCALALEYCRAGDLSAFIKYARSAWLIHCHAHNCMLKNCKLLWAYCKCHM